MSVNKEFHIYRNLAALNDLDSDDAESAFFECSGSHQWSRRMAELRPFPMVGSLFATTEIEWNALTLEEQIESFGHASLNYHDDPNCPAFTDPPIAGSGIRNESNIEKENKYTTLTDAINLYEKKFGFIFVVGSQNLSDREKLAVCRERSLNSLDTETRVAAGEKLKIIESRLGQLLEK